MTRPRTYHGLDEVTEYVVPEPGHWISKCCGAHCGPRNRTCWNCGAARNRVRAAQVVEQRCAVDGCGTKFYGLVSLDGELIAMCPFDFDHRGLDCYYPPNFRPDLLWDLNGYEFDDETKKVSKLQGAKT